MLQSGHKTKSKEAIQRARGRNKVAREQGRKFAWDYLSTHPCVDCGECDPVVLEFDHVKGIKVASISSLVAMGYSIPTIQKEIEKCEVRCANCHREKTFGQLNWYSKKK
jgi:hypothetical protein